MFISSLKRPRRGIILLVALGILALFGILAAAYLTFASDSRQAAFSSAHKNFHAPKPEKLMHEAFMQILRGTTDPNSALFRQDLLGDYYGYHSISNNNNLGVSSLLSERYVVGALPTAALVDGANRPWRDRGVLLAGANVVKVPVRFDDANVQPSTQPSLPPGNPAWPENIYNSASYSSPLALDDALSGRTLSFVEGPLAGHTVRIVRWAGFRPATGGGSGQLSFRYSAFIDLGDPSLPSTVVLADGSVVRLDDILNPQNPNSNLPACLFYSAGQNRTFGSSGAPSEAGWPGSDDVPFQLVINPLPRNGSGTGVDPNTNITQPVSLQSGGVSLNLPVALQPNYSRWWNPNILISGNADEPYDAPDYDNMFLSSVQRDQFGTRVIPSFHRPALINYLLNAGGYDLSSPSNDQMRVVSESIRRATLRPLPFHNTQAFGGSHPRFTGGNPNFILRTPIQTTSSAPADVQRLDLLANALINGPWDVDNDGDGTPDSVWIDPQLPLITAPDGKLLRPLIAVQIEDLGSKFDVNAHGNPGQLSGRYLEPQTGPLAGKLTNTATAAALPSGRGYGPAEIFPLLGTGSIDASTGRLMRGSTPEVMGSGSALFNLLDGLLASKYSSGNGVEIQTWSNNGAVPEWQRPPQQQPGIRGMVAGASFNDLHDQRMHPYYPQIQTPFSRFGFSVDTYGQGGLGIDASGNLFASAAGVPLLFNPNTSTSHMDEAVNDPYEFDPTGRLTSDRAYTFSEMEALGNARRWDQHLYPSRLESIMSTSLASDPSIASIVTTYSSSDTRPSSLQIPEMRSSSQSRVQPNMSSDPNNPMDNVVPGPTLESLLARVINAGNISRPIDANDIVLANSLLAPELRLGMPINVNLPFGNGTDDNGNGFIDEAGEIAFNGLDDNKNGAIDEAGEIEDSYGIDSLQPQYNVDPYQAAPYNVGPAFMQESARQALARYLYCAAMLLATEENDPALSSRWLESDPQYAPDPDSYRARRLAQWAVNVVDYRDSDSTMTRFLYDEDPLDGWNPTGSLEVWGCEHPELLFMESLAFHNLGLKDTDKDSGTQKDTRDANQPDPNADQSRIPQGSAFLELYNARPRTTAATAVGSQVVRHHESLPGELYNATGLDLARLAPGRDLNNDGDVNDAGEVPAPVWRVAISEPHLDANESLSPLVQRSQFKDTVSFEPAQPLELDPSQGTTPDALKLERFVVFSHYADRTQLRDVAQRFGGTVPDESAIFSNLMNGRASLPLGTYMTIAPRTETHLGSQLDDAMGPTAPSPQVFTANPGLGDSLVHSDTAGARRTPDPANAGHGVRQSFVLLAQAFEPDLPGWNTMTPDDRAKLYGVGNQGIGFNISEPLPGASYYPLPDQYLMGSAGNFTLRDAYWNYNDPSTTPRDTPLDLEQDRPVGELSVDPEVPFLGSADNYRTAYLQRLADPTLPYQPDSTLRNYNPYRTVDWISMDLTVFSGDEREDRMAPPNPQNPPPAPQYIYESRQRTGEGDAPTPDLNLLFSNVLNVPQPAPLPAAAPGPPAPSYFTFVLEESLSYLNSAPDPTVSTYFGPRLTSADAGGYGDYIGQPRTPFALHPWLNRPYDSPLELMFVPACSQGRLFEEFSIATNNNFYTASDHDEFTAPFGHLLNFFDSSDAAVPRSDLFRIFDLLGTGPKYRGSTDPTSSLLTSGSLGTTTTGASDARDFWRQLIAFPFNQFPRFSEQGRLNLNTLGDQRVFAGLMWGHLPANERANAASASWLLWQDFMAARRGFRAPNVTSTIQGGARPYTYAPYLHGKYPTEFAARFTDRFVADYAPTLDSIGGDDPARLQKPQITGTLLRPKPDGAGNGFQTDATLFARATTGPHDDVDRSSIMRYQSLTRLPNLTTEHSNAYLIRMTMGFFEVDPGPGLNLGREHLSDYGRNKRYRATYIVDRSIPCQYETGVDHDAEKLILFQRFYSE